MTNLIFINGNRDGYAPEQCAETLTVGELVAILLNFNPEAKVYLKNDGGYTYGSINYYDITGGEE